MSPAIVALSLVLAVVGPDVSDPQQLTAQQKVAALAPRVKSATDCIAKAVTENPQRQSAKLGDAIVSAMPECVTPVRAMIDAYDQYFGAGTGEAFFMGPYLDVLPKAVEEYKKQ